MLERFRREWLDDVTLTPQYRLQDVFRYHPGFNPRRQRSPTPKPDYVLFGLHARHRFIQPPSASSARWHRRVMEERAGGQQWMEVRNGPCAGIETPTHLLPQIGIARSERRVLQVGDVLAFTAGRPKGGSPPQDSKPQIGHAMDVAQEAQLAEVPDVKGIAVLHAGGS